MDHSNRIIISLDSHLPPEVAARAEDIGVSKGNLDFLSMFMLAVLAGAFIAFGAIFYTTVVTGITDKIGFGITKLLGGLPFTTLLKPSESSRWLPGVISIVSVIYNRCVVSMCRAETVTRFRRCNSPRPAPQHEQAVVTDGVGCA